VSLFERCYLEALNDGQIQPFRGKFVAQAAARQPLTVEEYRNMPAQEIARKYLRKPQFRADVDDLIHRKLI
jgi:hypothetical protein